MASFQESRKRQRGEEGEVHFSGGDDNGGSSDEEGSTASSKRRKRGRPPKDPKNLGQFIREKLRVKAKERERERENEKAKEVEENVPLPDNRRAKKDAAAQREREEQLKYSPAADIADNVVREVERIRGVAYKAGNLSGAYKKILYIAATEIAAAGSELILRTQGPNAGSDKEEMCLMEGRIQEVTSEMGRIKRELERISKQKEYLEKELDRLKEERGKESRKNRARRNAVLDDTDEEDRMEVGEGEEGNNREKCPLTPRHWPEPTETEERPPSPIIITRRDLREHPAWRLSIQGVSKRLEDPTPPLAPQGDPSPLTGVGLIEALRAVLPIVLREFGLVPQQRGKGGAPRGEDPPPL